MELRFVERNLGFRVALILQQKINGIWVDVPKVTEEGAPIFGGSNG